MNLAFILSMPNVASWNGKWSGSDSLHAVVRKVSDAKKHQAKYGTLIGKSFYYNFGDGWGASVDVKSVTSQEVRQIRKSSKGFCGYEWMIDEILDHGRIMTLAERLDKAPVAEPEPATI